jgi:hypothetical protein
MLEKYFTKGVEYTWSQPAAIAGIRNGVVIANPAVAVAPMVYAGIDKSIHSIFDPGEKSLGLVANMQIPFTWLAYVKGQTTDINNAPTDVLTGPMSGCLIARWTDMMGGIHVGHVGTVEVVDRNDFASVTANRLVKDTFSNFMPVNTKGFYPAQFWSPKEQAQKMKKFKPVTIPRVFALVTAAGDFFSILMAYMVAGSNTGWCSAGYKRIAGTRYDDLRRELAR